MHTIKREFNISLSELILNDGIPLSTKLSDIQKSVLSIGQELCLMRQTSKPVSVDEYELLECKCWHILDILEEL